MLRFFTTAAFMSCAALAHAGEMMVQGAWVPDAPAVAKSRAAYFMLHNHSSDAVALVSAEAEGFARAEIHESKMVDGLMTMAHLSQIEIPSGSMVELKPGGIHVMLMNPEAPLEIGDEVTITLSFSDGSTLPVSAMVKSRKDVGHDHNHDHGKEHKHDHNHDS